MAIPVSPVDARRQLRMEIDDDSRDDDIAGWIDDAAGWVENYTGHVLVARDVTETFYGFGAIRPRAWPIASNAAVSVSYPGTPDPIVVAGARVEISSRPARIMPAIGARWPSVAAGTPVTVTYRAGYEDGDEVPRNIRRAMLLLISAYDEDREGGDIFAKAEAAARRLCGSLRVRRL